MARVRKIICKDCNTEFEIPLSANFMYFCPECREYIGSECEYGYAAIVPCEIYVGSSLIGRITGEAGAYRLDCTEPAISTGLKGKYKDLEIYHEAVEIIKKSLAERETGR